MNASTTAETLNTATPSRGRGRGRGGGPAPRSGSTTGRPAAKPQASKMGPTRLLEAEWVKDAVLKGDAFIMYVGSGQKSTDQQWTFHRPIGETNLDGNTWVATFTQDVSFLLMRRESEALLAWKRKAELAKRQEVLAARKGRGLGPDGSTEVWTFDGAPAIQPTIQNSMAAAKAAGAKESEWLSYADNAVQVQERHFKDSLRTQEVPPVWLLENPKPFHETRGGPTGDQPQKAVPYLYGLTAGAARDKVLLVAIGREPAASIGGDSSIAPTPTQAYGPDGGKAPDTATAVSGPSGTSPKRGAKSLAVGRRQLPDPQAGAEPANADQPQ